MESIVHQIKDRESKLYTSKAEVHVSSMKEHTSIPKIDPLSRKIADEITKRELAQLGIKTKEPAGKSLIPKSPKFKFPSKRNTHKSLSKPCELPLVEAASDAPLEGKFEVVISEAIEEQPCPRRSKTEIVTPKDLVIVQEQISIRQFKRKKTMEMMDNLHHLNAFREELHKDYPELALDVSCEGSSFRTDELNDIESHSHEANNHERQDLKVSPVPYLNTEESHADGNAPPPVFAQVQEPRIDENASLPTLNPARETRVDENPSSPVLALTEEKTTSEVFNRQSEEVENNRKEKTEGNNLDEVSKDKLLENERVNNKNSGVFKKNVKYLEIKESLSAISAKTKFELSPTHSKIVSMLTDQGTFTAFNSSYLKASFLHTAQESINSSVPRCHLSLLNCKSTPVYYSVRLSADSKVKTSNGVGSVNSLRHFLLNDEVRPKASTPKDLYSKNLEWAKSKEKRIKQLRKSIDLKEQQKCTFNPFPHKKRSETETFESKSSFFSQKSSLNSPASILKISSNPPENLINYIGLSPVGSSIRYSEGCNMRKMLKNSKPMVIYRQVNLLK